MRRFKVRWAVVSLVVLLQALKEGCLRLSVLALNTLGLKMLG